MDKEKQGLDEVEDEINATVERDRVASSIEGSNQKRYFDGLYKNSDGSYTAVEVKSGSAFERYLRGEGKQRRFDESISPESPATATLNGEQIWISRVRVKETP